MVIEYLPLALALPVPTSTQGTLWPLLSACMTAWSGQAWITTVAPATALPLLAITVPLTTMLADLVAACAAPLLARGSVAATLAAAASRAIMPTLKRDLGLTAAVIKEPFLRLLMIFPVHFRYGSCSRPVNALRLRRT
jgi:hypothetical protein